MLRRMNKIVKMFLKNAAHSMSIRSRFNSKLLKFRKISLTILPAMPTTVSWQLDLSEEMDKQTIN